MTLALVAIGGAIGASLRYLLVLWSGRVLSSEFPAGVMIANILGSFVIGVLAVVILERAPPGWERWAPLLITGLLGGFTTFSAFSLDALVLLERERYTAAALYVGGSVLFSILAALLGVVLARAALA